MSLPFGEDITVTTRTQSGTDGFGNPTYSTAEITRSGGFNPAIGVEMSNGQDQVVTQPQAFFTGQDGKDVEAIIDSTSMLTIRGKDYEVDGDAEWVRSPFTGWEAGLVVPLKRTTG